MSLSGPADGNTNEIVQRFHTLYYGRRRGTWLNTYWLGVSTAKCPLDLWIYQEILFETRPDVVIETGTYHGGSGHFLACMCDLIDCGRVITIDLGSGPGFPEHPAHPAHDRLTYLTGSSVAPETVAAVAESIDPKEQVMVILDSEHRKDHVLGELRAYGPLVTQGKYLIVEDTNINGHPVAPRHGPGPMEAVEEFLAEQDGFVVDSSREKFLLTFNPGGFLKRVS